MKAPKKYSIKLTVEQIGLLNHSLLNQIVKLQESGEKSWERIFENLKTNINNQLPEHY